LLSVIAAFFADLFGRGLIGKPTRGRCRSRCDMIRLDNHGRSVAQNFGRPDHGAGIVSHTHDGIRSDVFCV
jgi:hypothetical protein